MSVIKYANVTRIALTELFKKEERYLHLVVFQEHSYYPSTSANKLHSFIKVKLCIYRTDNGCGWGVKALENIKKGSFVVEYVGEVITSEEAEERGKKYGKCVRFSKTVSLKEKIKI